MENSIIKLLNSLGYSNTGDNRKYSIRSINTLIDAGFLEIKFTEYEKSKLGWGWFWETKPGKKARTLYRVTLFGKIYNGHFMPSKCRSSIGMGFPDDITDIDYKKIDLFAVLTRIAGLISLNKNGFDFMKTGDCECRKCNGRGFIPQFSHYANGVCFDCGGSGIDRDTLKAYVESNKSLA